MKRGRPALRAFCALVVLPALTGVLANEHAPAVHLAYIGPGAGFAFLGSFLTVVISLLAGLFSLIAWPFRLLWLAVRRRGRFGNARVKKAIFLGLDGLDPALTEKWMAEGKLPNLSQLRAQGHYGRLRTTFPPLSPVAWSTFATGVNPARHNIFDFLNRDLRTYVPELSSAKVHPATRYFRIGRWAFPLSRPLVELRRKSEPFWKILGRNGIGSTILRVPITFPPERFNGRLLSAMSTPDLRGTQGMFSWFSTRPAEANCEGGVRLPLLAEKSGWSGSLQGPEASQLRFRIRRADTADEYVLVIGGETYPLRPGEYTPWVRLRFQTAKAAARGIVRFLLTETAPHLSLYATPVEIDPESPVLPISHPSHYAIYLAKLLGSFATLGMAEDTWALNEGAIDEDAFLDQVKGIQREREAMFFSTIERTRHGVVACVFDTTDRVQHMFYRYLDSSEHAAGSQKYAHVIEDLYRDMDRIVGQTLRYAGKDSALFVLSDHGFCSFRRGINLNSWLHANGYLTLSVGLNESAEYLGGIDWSRTRAYTFGLSGLYLNLQGREGQGIVSPAEAAALRAEIAAKLVGMTDPETGDVAIRAVYDTREIYRGPYADAAPDLVIGYAPGYRASWSAAAGKVTQAIFEDNVKHWSGDHCVDPEAVPGVLFANRRLDAENAGIEDLAPTALELFGVDVPKWMEGRSLLPAA